MTASDFGARLQSCDVFWVSNQGGLVHPLSPRDGSWELAS